MCVAEVEPPEQLEHEALHHLAVDLTIKGVEILLQVLKHKFAIRVIIRDFSFSESKS